MRTGFPVLFLAWSLLAAPALAQEFKPFAQARVSPAQWQDYFDQVRDRLGEGEIDAAAQLVLLRDDARRTSYVFTRPGHPAHPAWITRRLQEEGGRVQVRQVGFYAGSLQAFSVLFEHYLRLAERARDELSEREPRP